MSVFIKGMEMPENCFECPCCRHDSRNGHQKEQCNLTLDVFDKNYFERLEGRARNCPLAEVPTPHGRLIDERVAGQYIGDHMMGIAGREGRSDWQRVHDGLADTPTVIEAEREEQ